jgi:hypothetical protein
MPPVTGWPPGTGFFFRRLLRLALVELLNINICENVFTGSPVVTCGRTEGRANWQKDQKPLKFSVFVSSVLYSVAQSKQFFDLLNCEECSLLDCNAVQFGDVLTFRRNISRPYSGWKSKSNKKPGYASDKRDRGVGTQGFRFLPTRARHCLCLEGNRTTPPYSVCLGSIFNIIT